MKVNYGILHILAYDHRTIAFAFKQQSRKEKKKHTKNENEKDFAQRERKIF